MTPTSMTWPLVGSSRLAVAATTKNSSVSAWVGGVPGAKKGAGAKGDEEPAARRRGDEELLGLGLVRRGAGVEEVAGDEGDRVPAGGELAQHRVAVGVGGAD